VTKKAPAGGTPSPRYFTSPASFRVWLEANHATVRELWVGFYRKSTGKAGIAYLEAVDEALCFGWIDGVKKRVDEERYVHRFTPRKADSTWSVVNTKRMKQLVALGRVAPRGLETFTKRDRAKTGRYTYERAHAAFDGALEKIFRGDARAWTFFRAQPPGYQKLCTYWVLNARQEETRRRRLAVLMQYSAEGKRMR
jgi:uncharacterized protein YdeI (YjbR/CyaY-like superfamily)